MPATIRADIPKRERANNRRHRSISKSYPIFPPNVLPELIGRTCYKDFFAKRGSFRLPVWGGEEQKRDPGKKPSGKLKNSRLLSQPEKVFPTLLAIWHAYVVEEDIEIPINNVPPLAVAGDKVSKKKNGRGI